MKKILILLFITFSAILTYSLDFRTIAENINNTYEVQNSILEVEQLEKEFLSLNKPKDINFTLAPSFKTINPDNGIMENSEITGTLSAKIPLGLSKPEQDKVLFASNTLTFSESNIESAKFSTFIKLYKLYKNLLLLQSEEKVLLKEVESAKEYNKVLLNKFKAGTTPLLSLNNSIEEKQERESSYDQNILKQRLAWYEMMFTAGLEKDPEPLEVVKLEIVNVPNPRELSDWVLTNHPQILAEKIKIEQLRHSKESLKRADIDINLKPSYSSPNNKYSASMNYNFTTKELSPAVSMNNEGNSDAWSTSIMMSMSIGTNRSDNLSIAVLDLEIKMAEERLNYLINSLGLNIRATYQNYMQNKESLVQAEQNLISSKTSHDLVVTKMKLGQLAEYDILASEALVKRAEWKVEAAQNQHELSWLNLLELSVWYRNIDILY